MAFRKSTGNRIKNIVCYTSIRYDVEATPHLSAGTNGQEYLDLTAW